YQWLVEVEHARGEGGRRLRGSRAGRERDDDVVPHEPNERGGRGGDAAKSAREAGRRGRVGRGPPRLTKQRAPGGRPPRAPGEAPRVAAARRPSWTIEGRFVRSRSGLGFVEVDPRRQARFSRDILIPDGLEHDALHGDRVRIELTRHDPRTRRAAGRIVEVIR